MRATRDELFLRLLDVIEDRIIPVVPEEQRKEVVKQVRWIREDLWEIVKWECDGRVGEAVEKKEIS